MNNEFKSFEIVDDNRQKELEKAYENGELKKTGETLNINPQNGNEMRIKPISWNNDKDKQLYGEIISESKGKSR